MCSIFLSIWICLKNHTLTNNTLTYIYYQNHVIYFFIHIQKQPPRAFPRKRCSENMQQICRRTPMPKCKSHYENLKIEITLWHGSSPVNLLRIFRTTFPGNTSGCLFLYGVQEKPKEFFYTGNLK